MNHRYNVEELTKIILIEIDLLYYLFVNFLNFKVFLL